MPFVYKVHNRHPAFTIQREEYEKETAVFYITAKGRRFAKIGEFCTYCKSFEEALNLQSKKLQEQLVYAKNLVERTKSDIARLPKLTSPTDADYLAYLKERV